MSTRTLRVNILGPGFGECIALSFPQPDNPSGTGWGIIDCYTPNLLRLDEHPVVGLLRNRDYPVEELEFVCLTHSHADHYEGMSHLFKSFTVKRFWRFGTVNLKTVLKHFETEAETSTAPADSLSAREYEDIIGAVNRIGKTAGAYLRVVALSNPIWPDDANHSELKIFALAPDSSLCDKYERILENLTEPRGRLHPDHNLPSVVLALQYGQTRVLFGGDAGTASWEMVRHWKSRPPLKSVLVKVSHHGSLGSWSESAWKEIGATADCYAVITPFRLGAVRLPDAELVELIRPFCSTIISTGESRARPLSAQFRAWNKDRPDSLSPAQPSQWSMFEFDNSGHMVNKRLSIGCASLHGSL